MLKSTLKALLLTLILTASSWAQGQSANAISQMLQSVQQRAQQTNGMLHQAQQSGDQQALQVLQFESQVHQRMYQMLSQMQPMAPMMDQNPQAYQQLMAVWQEYDYRSRTHDWGQTAQNAPMQQNSYPAQAAYPQQNSYPTQNAYPQNNAPAQTAPTGGDHYRTSTGGPDLGYSTNRGPGSRF